MNIQTHGSAFARSPRIVAAMVLVFACTIASANDHVIGIRTEKVDLYETPKGIKKDEIRKEAFKGPWLIIKGPEDGFLHVRTEKGDFWVRRFAVETTQRVQSATDCNAVISGRQQKSAATRGLGGEC